MSKYQACYRQALELLLTHDRLAISDFIKTLIPKGFSKEEILDTVNELCDKGLLGYSGDEFEVADWLCK